MPEGSSSTASTRAGDSSSASWKSLICAKYASDRRRFARPPAAPANSWRTTCGSPGPARRNVKSSVGHSDSFGQIVTWVVV